MIFFVSLIVWSLTFSSLLRSCWKWTRSVWRLCTCSLRWLFLVSCSLNPVRDWRRHNVANQKYYSSWGRNRVSMCDEIHNSLYQLCIPKCVRPSVSALPQTFVYHYWPSPFSTLPTSTSCLRSDNHTDTTKTVNCVTKNIKKQTYGEFVSNRSKISWLTSLSSSFWLCISPLSSSSTVSLCFSRARRFWASSLSCWCRDEVLHTARFRCSSSCSLRSWSISCLHPQAAHQILKTSHYWQCGLSTKLIYCCLRICSRAWML